MEPHWADMVNELEAKVKELEAKLKIATENAAQAVKERDEAQDALAKATTRQCYIDRELAERERNELRASIHAAARQLEVAEEKEGDAPHAAASHFREAVRTIARTLPLSVIEHNRGAVWGELREMDQLHTECESLRRERDELRERLAAAEAVCELLAKSYLVMPGERDRDLLKKWQELKEKQ